MGAQGRTDVHVLILIDRHPVDRHPAVGGLIRGPASWDGRHKKRQALPEGAPVRKVAITYSSAFAVPSA